MGPRVTGVGRVIVVLEERPGSVGVESRVVDVGVPGDIGDFDFPRV